MVQGAGAGSGIGEYYLANLASGGWKLYWLGWADSGNVYPAVTVLGTKSHGTLDYLRIPTPTWLPTPLAYDTFTRSNGAIGTSETTGPDSQTTPAKTWTGATWTIATNKTVNTPVPGEEIATGNTAVGTWYLITASEANHFYTGS